MNRSKYDELHDRFYTILSNKAGTRYERLAAFVFKYLHEQNVVIHDMKVVGKSKIPHQIDVVVESDGSKKRVLVECKDTPKQRVGLSVIRDFRSVVEDTSPDDAFVVTCTGYTAPAMRYAKAKGIKLAVLRAFEEADWQGYFRSVSMQLNVKRLPTISGLELSLDQAEGAAFASDIKGARIGMKVEGSSGIVFRDNDPIFLVSYDERIQYCDFLMREIERERLQSVESTISLNIDPQKWKIQCDQGSVVRFTKFSLQATFHAGHSIEIEITPNRVAELILKGFGDKDVIVFDEHLRAMTIRPDAARKRLYRH